MSIPVLGWGVWLGLVVGSAVLVRVMMWGGVVDVPAGRKAHARPTPTSGGVGMMGACVAASVLLPAFRAPYFVVGLVAALGLGLLGWVADRRACGVWVKLGAQILAAMLAVGVLPGGWGLGGMVAAGVWLIFMTNMFNFMDGLDGLAGGSGLVAAVFLAVVAPPGSPIQIGALALAAGLAGFPPFNLAPARIFMGDAGSLFCGFFLGFLGLSLADGSVESTLLLVPMLMGGVVFDVVLTLIRRLWAGARLTQGHREHLYQRKALADGWVAALHWGFVLCGGLAWLMLEQGGYGAAIGLLVVPQLVWWGFVVRRGPMWIG